jgi:2-polyprenyl-6-methoxyphenol hydroxylase-like FAD-dependent oxidoreductase
VEARFEVAADEGVEGLSPVHTKVVRAKLLVGVDGIRSQVRNVLVGDEPRDLLLVTWNAVVPAEDVR